jgi:hypothetical protein
VSLYKIVHLSLLPPRRQIAACGKAPDHSFVRILRTRRPIENGAANFWEENSRQAIVERQSDQNSSLDLRELITN